MPAQKLKPCSNGPKHSWTHVKDVTFKSMTIGPTGSRVKFSVRGKYRCECGEVKYGSAKEGLLL